MTTTTSCSFGSTQNAVPAAPPQLNSPAEPGMFRHAVAVPDGEAEPEAVARQRPRHRGLDRVEVIGRHVVDRRPAEQTRAVELSAVQQHLQKARVVAGRSRGARTPGVVLCATVTSSSVIGFPSPC